MRSATAPPERPISVFAVDDHVLVLDGLCSVLASDPRFLVAGRASSTPEALHRLRQTPADVVLVDLAMGRGSGLDLIRSLQAELPRVRCLVVTMHEPAVYAERVLRAGGRGFIGKDAPTDALFDAILTVGRGQISLPEPVRTRILLHAARGEPVEGSADLHRLTDREIDVLRLFGEGLRTQEVAARLGISPKTVETHRTNLKRKLQIDGLGELIRYAVEAFRP